MKILANREGLLAAFGMVSSAVPARSPKPILQNVKLTASSDGSTLYATDLEVRIAYRVLGVKVDSPGSVILPTAKVMQVLRSSRDEELAIEVDGESLTIRGLHSVYELQTDDPDLFPSVPEFDTENYHAIGAADLKRLIRRTMFATDVESTRYALGGVLFEFTADTLATVGTDGRRLAKMTASVEVEGIPITSGSNVVPVKALKLIDRNLDDDDPPVHIAINSGNSALFRTDRATIYTRLVEGRFPRYQDVFPPSWDIRVAMEVGGLLSAVDQASIVTSEESRGVDFTFGHGMLTLKSQAADVGKATIEYPIDHDGKDVEITFDPRYLADALKALEPTVTFTAELVDHKNAAVFRTDDGYSYVIMPLTRDR